MRVVWILQPQQLRRCVCFALRGAPSAGGVLFLEPIVLLLHAEEVGAAELAQHRASCLASSCVELGFGGILLRFVLLVRDCFCHLPLCFSHLRLPAVGLIPLSFTRDGQGGTFLLLTVIH